MRLTALENLRMCLDEVILDHRVSPKVRDPRDLTKDKEKRGWPSEDGRARSAWSHQKLDRQEGASPGLRRGRPRGRPLCVRLGLQGSERIKLCWLRQGPDLGGGVAPQPPHVVMAPCT